jgi:monoamine oxidase
MHDVIVIGAGAAGLAAATALRSSGLEVVVLEARQRAGGRCWSVVHEASPIPVELGAEFVHGTAAQTERLAREAGTVISDVAGEQWRARGGRLTRQHDFWERVGRVISRVPRGAGPDVSFGDYLGHSPGGRALAYDRSLARAFVQGFHAADLDRISARALAESGNPGVDEDASRHGRTVGGYERVLAPLIAQVSDAIRFGEIVRRVQWRPRHVTVETERTAFAARAAIITLPLGVLQAGAVVIDPLPTGLQRALAGLAMGSVARVTLLFDERFWERDRFFDLPGDATLSALSFLHTPDSPFNIWWTLYPLRAPAIVGWSGGPPAAALQRGGDVEQRAVAELAAQLGVPRRRLRSLLVATFHHDWDADPFSRGAYSYALVGGATASRRLARPVGGTLFLAGEATADADSGTVEGALKSGRRAAQQLRAASGSGD